MPRPSPTTADAEPAGAVLIRISTLPSRLVLPDPPAADADLATLRDWLQVVWAKPDVRAAVTNASTTLAAQVDQILRSGASRRRTRRAVYSTAMYLLRWQGRATPFGLFAGIAPVTAGAARVAPGGQQAVRARVDAAWFAMIIGILETDSDLLPHLRVQRNTGVRRRGDHYVLEAVTGPEQESAGSVSEIAVRVTRPVTMALEVAHHPVRVEEVVAKLLAEFPGADHRTAADLITGMVRQHLLVTELRAPMSVADPYDHLLARLDALADNGGERTRSMAAVLADIRGELAHRPFGAANHMTAIAAVAQPVHVDVRSGLSVSVPETVLTEAAAVAGVLLDLSAHPYGLPAWKSWHTGFRHRYGPGAVVPVTKVLADSGLGFPAGYLGSGNRPPAQVSTDRDRVLLRLAQQAWSAGASEVVLTDRILDELRVDRDGSAAAPGRVELAFHVHAESIRDLDRGHFRLQVTGVPRPASSMAGRLLPLLPDPEVRRWAHSYGADDATLTAQISGPPRHAGDDALARTPQLLDAIITIGEHRELDPQVLTLDDLAVTADARHLYLIDLRTGQTVTGHVVNALEAGRHTLPTLRFLAEVSTARCTAYQRFQWGTAASLPYLPAVRYRRTTLISARWLLTAADLAGPEATTAGWDAALAAWRHQWRCPPRVVLHEGELRLPLDLRQAGHRWMLRGRLKPGQQIELHEGVLPSATGWIGRQHEILMAVRTHGPAPAPRRPTRPVPGATVHDQGVHLPGAGEWLCLRVFGHPARQDDVLLTHLPRLVDDLPATWWFRRCRDLARPDGDQYLEVLLPVPDPSCWGEMVTRAGTWCAEMRASHLVPHAAIVAYTPHVGRYGHGPALDAVHAVFAADAQVAIMQMHVTAATETPLLAMTAASLADLTLGYTGGPKQAASWLIDCLRHDAAPVPADVQDAALQLSSAALDGDVPAALTAAWQTRRDALHRYVAAVAGQPPEGRALLSLLNAHHRRVAGINPEQERVTLHLVRSAALRYMHRRRP